MKQVSDNSKIEIKGGEMKMKTLKVMSAAVVGAAVLLSSVGSASAMLNEDGTSKVPTSPDQMVIMSVPADVQPVNSEVIETDGTSDIIPISAPIDAVPISEGVPTDGIYYLNGASPSGISINGKVIEAPTAYAKDDRVMVPIRAVAEALGFKVTWDGENKTVGFARLANNTQIQIGKDSYFFARVAPRELGIAPELTNGSTFVPLEFVSEILKAEVKIGDNGSIQIADKE